MDATEARKANLLVLERRLGSLEALGAKTDTPPSYLSNIKTDKRNMGRKVARRIEKELELPTGWMDTIDHGAAQKVIGAAILVADFEALPVALQEHVSKVASDLRKMIDGIPPDLREAISAPPKDPERYAAWEASIRALIASEGR